MKLETEITTIIRNAYFCDKFESEGCVKITKKILRQIYDWLNEECPHLPPKPCKRLRCGVCLKELEQQSN